MVVLIPAEKEVLSKSQERQWVRQILEDMG